MPPEIQKSSQQIGDAPNLCMALDLTYNFVRYSHTHIYIYYIIYIYYNIFDYIWYIYMILYNILYNILYYIYYIISCYIILYYSIVYYIVLYGYILACTYTCYAKTHILQKYMYTAYSSAGIRVLVSRVLAGRARNKTRTYKSERASWAMERHGSYLLLLLLIITLSAYFFQFTCCPIFCSVSYVFLFLSKFLIFSDCFLCLLVLSPHFWSFCPYMRLVVSIKHFTSFLN